MQVLLIGGLGGFPALPSVGVRYWFWIQMCLSYIDVIIEGCGRWPLAPGVSM